MKANSDELGVFVTVVEAGSLTAASQQLDLAPSAVSRTVSKLEEKLGVTLLNRTTRRMNLTEEGAFFFAQAKDILQRMDALEEHLSARQHSPVGRLRINAATPFMLHAVVPHIDAFRALYPDIELQLNTNELNIDLLAESTDIAIRIGALSDSTLHARSLGASTLNVLASPDYLAKHGAPTHVDALTSHTLLGFTEPDFLNTWPLRHQGGDALQIAPALRASSGETIRQLALAGQGIACLAGFMTARDIESGRLVPVLPDYLVTQLQPIHAVYYRNSTLALRIRCFLDFMQERLTGYWEPHEES
ncbi:LysR family transcriptional regulator [Paraburkholderia sp.]|uniref:LysR family transcriptional regulator n=1 Tax=Paraburkholderia sp. TaxID=1926495 RepID=UPI0023949E66|nr:LysR family transcriptional regulator [Paraburkholderia sp.]MDE1184247.1 LysR family transcriptional regulator [Paraburkholderia sp.]